MTHDDGTSHLMLSGLQRVEVIGYEQHAPFRLASVMPLDDQVEDASAATALGLEVVDLFAKLGEAGLPVSEALQTHLSSTRDPGAIADIVGHNLVAEPLTRQKLIDETVIDRRLELLREWMGKVLANHEA
ncbi:MAG: LON peptidase substrate-binding domain-containing protein [Verrucomicrobiota bacterium]